MSAALVRTSEVRRGKATAGGVAGTLAPLVLLLVLAACEGSTRPATIPDTALRLLMDSTTDQQTGMVGTELARHLRVTAVAAGVPQPGVVVHWEASAGTIPATSTTDAAGIAEAPWTLDTMAGSAFAYAGPAADPDGVRFAATAVPGPIANISIVDDSQQVPADYPAFAPLAIKVTDRYSNGISAPVAWTVVSGPVAVRSGMERAPGFYSAEVAPTGGTGTAVVRAQFADTTVDFHLTALAPVPVAILDPNTGFTSRSGVQPAVDTIPVGGSMTWVLYPYDYGSHSVTAAGSPAFSGADFPYPVAGLSVVTVNGITTPGTYRYADVYGGWSGTLVVR